jgi:two-component system phosphate regulon response regulator OmpR
MSRVLIIDDEPDIRAILKDLLTEAGYEAAELDSAVDAVNFLSKDSNFDLILCDITMPKLTGLEFLAQLKLRHGENPPVVMLTAHGEKEKILEALRLGAADYIEKPFNPATFIERVSKMSEVGRRKKEIADTFDGPIAKKNEKMIGLLRASNNQLAKK